MKFFISHANKDEEIAKAFSNFLSNLDVNVNVFCSSQSGTIDQGDDFVKKIESELKQSDVFIPLISLNYIKSKYCLIELGYAYAKSAEFERRYFILPFCIAPITKSQALLGTPLAHLQTAALNDKVDVHNFLRVLIKNNLLEKSYAVNEDIIYFIDKMNNYIMKNENILGNAVPLPICSDGSNRDAIQHNEKDGKHIVNFNLFADGKNKRPDFISLVLKFPGLFNFYNFLISNADIKFYCLINNYTNSLTSIDIEFKYHESHQMLKSYKIELKPGINDISIPIRQMNIEGLKQISEICFVAWDPYITEIEGMFSVENIQVK